MRISLINPHDPMVSVSERGSGFELRPTVSRCSLAPRSIESRRVSPSFQEEDRGGHVIGRSRGHGEILGAPGGGGRAESSGGHPDYEPTSRRPIADLFRRTATAAVGFCVRWGVHPDAISYASIIAAAAAGICFWQSGRYPLLLLVAPLFCYVRLWLNMLDGMVALAADKASARGEILNDLPDRVSDLMIFVGVAHSGLCHPLGGYWAAIFALLTAYVGLFGQAVGVQRQFAGLMSKPWRMVALHIGAWVALALIWTRGGNVPIGPLTALDWANLLVIVGCMQTIAVRLRRVMAALARRDTAASGD